MTDIALDPYNIHDGFVENGEIMNDPLLIERLSKWHWRRRTQALIFSARPTHDGWTYPVIRAALEARPPERGDPHTPRNTPLHFTAPSGMQLAHHPHSPAKHLSDGRPGNSDEAIRWSERDQQGADMIMVKPGITVS
jgi:delta-aminolevulinic acid dehydratase/porphobilinogen synthase